jgi:hypothetical protein
MKIGGRKKERKFVMQKLRVLGTKQIGMANANMNLGQNLEWPQANLEGPKET